MMALAATMLILLILAVSLLVLPVVRRSGHAGAPTRDGLNTLFYRRRLAELRQDEAEGLIDERSQHIAELQQTLLTDIPPVPPAQRRPAGILVLAPGVLGLVVITLALYFWSGGIRQVRQWRQTVDELPALRARLSDPGARQLTPEELSRFAVGLRASLQREPENVQDWLILGRTGVVLNDNVMATRAFERAWRLAPADSAIALDYADALTRSADPGENRDGSRLLQALVRRQPDNLRALGLLALSQYQQGNFSQAIAFWRHLLALLPADDPHVFAVRQGIAQAREQGGMETAKLEVDVNAAARVCARLPRRGRLFIVISDGDSLSPVAVKTLPLSRFPLSLSLDDSDAVAPDRLLSGLHQLKVRVRLSSDGTAEPKSGDWFGEGTIGDFNGTGRIAVQIDQQVP